MNIDSAARPSGGFSEQPLPSWRRAVLKVGSSLLTENGAGLSRRHVVGLAAFVADSLAAGREVIIVSSGAVAAGRAILPTQPARGAAMAARQAFAALGQARMVGLWQDCLARPVAQVLLTHDDLRNRRRYLNARATLSELLRLGAVPVINENDTVSVDELKLGDNDNLAAIVAALVEADLLLIATDIDGLFTANPRTDPTAQPVETIDSTDPKALAMAGGAGTATGTGGMRTKLEAATRAARAGIDTVLFNGTDAVAVALLGAGRLRGTRLRAGQTRLAARKHWLQQVPLASGSLLVDEGAARALVGKGASLLPGGILAVRGEFARGDMVAIAAGPADGEQPVARGLTQYSAADVRRIARRHSRDIESLLGYNYGESVIHRDDMVTD
ncbi:glutamate 5-kinase [Dokdonella immobilis]|uniref:Glutamate 5-kinase n=1 Tax=Dokdonella immobilis TaxID=578942 RepID=A0A1I4X0Y3_9GAMM|nr:glutamate 5-kinase [Dokdonella immobilis]SFN19654.1 glutamate 5-kinase [Dokdonella immobilis]